VPGHPFDARTYGCNMLIRDGATLIRNAEDIIEALGPVETQTTLELPLEMPQTPKRSLRETAGPHDQILQRLGPSPVAEDQLIRDLGGDSKVVSPILMTLELDGRISRQAGGLLALSN
jgi:DNA processing protein